MALAPQLAVSLQTDSRILQVMKDIVQSAHEFQQNSAIGAIVLTGEGNKAFAAGADIKEMASKTYSQVQHRIQLLIVNAAVRYAKPSLPSRLHIVTFTVAAHA